MAKTKEEKREYYKLLRADWQRAKEEASKDCWKSAHNEALKSGLRISITGFVFCKLSMEAQGLDGTPYIDAKTFKGWKSVGYTVKKGEKSKIHGITWLKASKNTGTEIEAEKNVFVYPKVYALFHSSQVQPMHR